MSPNNGLQLLHNSGRRESEPQRVQKQGQNGYGRGGVADLANDWMEYGAHIVRQTARAPYHDGGANDPKTQKEPAGSPPQR